MFFDSSTLFLWDVWIDHIFLLKKFFEVFKVQPDY